MRALTSKTICCLHYILMFLVVTIHSGFNVKELGCDINENFPILYYISLLGSGIVSKVAVPLFFFISGFLFFNDRECLSFSFERYLYKVKKRTQSIFIPFLIWNCLFILYLGLVNGVNGWWGYNFSLTDWLLCFWDYSMINGGDHGPIYIYLWFIRDLYMMCLISPLFYYLYKMGMLIGCSILLLLCWCLTNDLHVISVSLCSITFFSLGSTFAMYKMDFVQLASKCKYTSLVVYFVTLLLLIWANLDFKVSNLNILFGAILVVSLISKLLDKGVLQINTLFLRSSFFIYLSHGIIIYFVRKLRLLLIPHYDIPLTLAYIITPIVTIIISIFFFQVLNLVSPRVLSYMTGGRSNKHN